ncbi:hypothetical protein KDL01_22190 [Actinospica durhamensis]|uniref:Leucine rich repeat variant n=1 Tax=Actinospica durhamensis TaxID=1508375 RepID=A0A941ET73_9ACTN|nr:hypothetical protein [Actinospica durhamensis]MBR7836002.1 hypothetical protein [Actinospica durhamensis]
MPAPTPNPATALPAFARSRLSGRMLRGLADNPAAPPEVLSRLTAAEDSIRFLLARRRDLPPQIAALFAADDDVRLRRELAPNPCLSADVQAVLAADADPQVRAGVAKGAQYFTTVGVHGRKIPPPLTREVYALLARDPEPEVRQALARNRHLPLDLRVALLDDDDAHTAAIAAAQWHAPPLDYLDALLDRITDAWERSLLLQFLDAPLPTHTAHALLAGIDDTPADESGRALPLLEQISAVADLDADLTSRFLASPKLRAAVAANPTLPSVHVAALAHDPHNEVRAAVVARRDLDPVLRESIPVEYDDGSYEIVRWVADADLPERDRLDIARSRHQILRKSLTLRSDLSDEIIAILARDESFAVRLFVCERQPSAPGWLLAEIVGQWHSFSRWDMIAHANFPADAAAALARSADSTHREQVADHAGLPVAAIEALLRDDDPGVRRRAAANRALPADCLIVLLGADDATLVAGAAANPSLPVPVMGHILDATGL